MDGSWILVSQRLAVNMHNAILRHMNICIQHARCEKEGEYNFIGLEISICLPTKQMSGHNMHVRKIDSLVLGSV